MDGQSGGFGLDSVGNGEWRQSLESGLLKLGQSAQGGLWGRGKHVATQWNKKGSRENVCESVSVC